MKKRNELNPQDPLELLMENVIYGFKTTTSAIQNLRDQQEELNQKLQQQARAAYQGMTGSGKSRYVTELVKIENEENPRGAQARVAELLGVTPGRITQVLKSNKNRKNGK